MAWAGMNCCGTPMATNHLRRQLRPRRDVRGSRHHQFAFQFIGGLLLHFIDILPDGEQRGNADHNGNYQRKFIFHIAQEYHRLWGNGICSLPSTT